MTLATDETIKWEGRDYFGGDEIGFTDDGAFVLHLFTTEPGEMRGTYFTALPISPKDYRAIHPTKAAIRDEGDCVVIFCDWGRPHRLHASRSVIEKLLAQAAVCDMPIAVPLPMPRRSRRLTSRTTSSLRN